MSTWRRAIAAVLLLALCAGLYRVGHWIWRDITYWSRSTEVAYRTDTLVECVRRVVAEMPGLSASFAPRPITLRVPQAFGVTIKDSSGAQSARIVVHGHSESISRLGPPAEEPVAALLRDLSGQFALRCGSP